MLEPKLERSRFLALTAAGACTLLGVWSLAALSGITSRTFLPAPWDVLARLAELVVEPFVGHVLHEHLLSSLKRFGLALAGLVGLFVIGMAALSYRLGQLS